MYPTLVLLFAVCSSYHEYEQSSLENMNVLTSSALCHKSSLRSYITNVTILFSEVVVFSNLRTVYGCPDSVLFDLVLLTNNLRSVLNIPLRVTSTLQISGGLLTRNIGS
jgi:hypothetical protein